MLYVYRRHASEGARELAEAMNLNCRRLKDLGQAHFNTGVRAGDTVICWGERCGAIQGVRILNGVPIQNKMQDALRLREKGVPTVEVNLVKPANPAPVDPAKELFEAVTEKAKIFGDLNFGRGPVVRASIVELFTDLDRLRSAIDRPLPPAILTAWVPRKFNHVGGGDLLAGMNIQADYWVRKEEIVKEFRIHSFLGKSIRAGQKVPREGLTPHAWIRSYDGGWKINYQGFSSTRAMRELAHKAVEALGLQFGAVDLAQKADGNLLVLEVNRAPGVEDGTVGAYARAIEGWARGE